MPRDSEFNANEALALDMGKAWTKPAPVRKPRRYWGWTASSGARKHYGWNHKALGLALCLFIAGTVAKSPGCMLAACFVLCFCIRPYWR
jgi:hypothetical protein